MAGADGPQPTIRVKCSCGKVLSAPAKLAGKRIQCPGCKQPVSLPGGKPEGGQNSSRTSPGQADKLRVKCRCGQVLTVDSQLAGKAVKCPKCQQAVRIPATQTLGRSAAASPLSGLLDEVGVTQSKTGKRCPECKADMATEAILCIECGYHLELRKKLRTQR